ncbi:MAG: hypothetical protein PHY62_07315 [Gallionella sp.]|nr:hypothetical protein [Gallionella sp.]
MFRWLTLIALFCISANTAALDQSDVGNYAVVHRDGHVTEFNFFVSLSGEQWNIEQRQPDGTWTNVTCTENCVLQKSNEQDIARFLPQDTREKINLSCVHNTAFAFCSISPREAPENKAHLLIALVQSPPIPLKLKKLTAEWKDRQGRAVPNTDAQKSANGFGGMLLITSDADWEKKWNTQPENTPHFTQAKNIGMGKKIFALTFFSNPLLNDKGEADVTCDIELFKPDGTTAMHQADAPCFKGKLKSNPHYLYLSAPVVAFVGETGDPLGEWRMSIALKDNLRKVTVPLKASFVLQ